MKAICLRARGEAWTRVLAVILHAREAKALVVPEPPKKGE
jgi:hypothetical protein